jgi:hypothetical protein
MIEGTGYSDLGLSENPGQNYDDDRPEDAGKNNSFEAQWKLLGIARRSSGMPQTIRAGFAAFTHDCLI